MSFAKFDQDAKFLRYNLVPQFREYDRLSVHLNRHTGMSAEPNIRSKILTTDQNGFRRTPSDSIFIDTETPPGEIDCILLGSSTVFGVGAKSDSGTIPAVASRIRNERWLNLGIRGGSSTQEVQALMPFSLTARRIVVCSGVNNLIIALQTDDGKRDVYHPLYFDQAFDLLASMPLVDIAKLVESNRGLRDRLRGPVLQSGRTENSSDFKAEKNGITFWHQMTKAAARQVRDIELVVRLAGSARNILFCAQPFADRATRNAVEQERSLIGVYDARQGDKWQAASKFAEAHWADYVDLLRRGCMNLGVKFLQISAADLNGWCFVDRVHLTDHGYAQVANQICEEIG